jgi:hypothetical protein
MENGGVKKQASGLAVENFSTICSRENSPFGLTARLSRLTLPVAGFGSNPEILADLSFYFRLPANALLKVILLSKTTMLRQFR